MSDSVDLGFTEQIASVEAIGKKLDGLLASVERLNRATLKDAKSAITDLAKSLPPGEQLLHLLDVELSLNKFEGMFTKSGKAVLVSRKKDAQDLLEVVRQNAKDIEDLSYAHIAKLRAIDAKGAAEQLATAKAQGAALLRLYGNSSDGSAQIAAARARVAGSTNALGLFISDASLALEKIKLVQEASRQLLATQSGKLVGSFTSEDALAMTRQLYELEARLAANREKLATQSGKLVGSFTSEDALAKTRQLYELEIRLAANREKLATQSAKLVGSFTSEDALAKTRQLYELEARLAANREKLATQSAKLVGSFTSEDALAKTRQLYELEARLAANREKLASTAERTLKTASSSETLSAMRAYYLQNGATPKYGASSFDATPDKAVGKSTLPKSKDLEDIGFSLKDLALHGNNAHSAIRGLASGFGLLWLTWGATLPLLAGAAASFSVLKSIKIGSELEQSLFVIGELAGTSSEEVAKLKDRIYELGASSKYGPRETAEALKILTLAGLTAADAMEALQPTLNFAAAGGLTTEKAAEVSVAVSTAFGYSAKQMETVNDIIAKTAADSIASVAGMSESFKASSALAQTYGVSLADVALGLKDLAQIGITGSAAGTSQRNMYTELAKSTGKVADTLKLLKVETQESSGGMKPYLDILRDITVATVNLTNKEQTRITSILSNERGMKQLSAGLGNLDKEMKASQQSLLDGTKALDENGNALTRNEARVLAVQNAYAILKTRQEESLNAGAGLTFMANIEKDLLTVSAFKGVLASLDTQLVKSFDNAQPAVIAFNASLRELINSKEVGDTISYLTGAMVGFGQVLVDIGKQFTDSDSFLNKFAPLILTAVGAVGAGIALLGAPVSGAALMIAGVGGLISNVFIDTEARIVAAAKTAQQEKIKATQIQIDQTTNSLNAELAATTKRYEAIGKNKDATEEAQKAFGAAAEARIRAHYVEVKNALILSAIYKQQNDIRNGGAVTQYGSLDQLAEAQGYGAQMQEAASRESADLTTLRNQLTQIAFMKQKIAEDDNNRAKAAVTRTQGDDTGPAAAEKAKNNRALLSKMAQDRLATIQASGQAELQALQNNYATQRQLLESQHSNHVISEGAFQYQLLDLVQTTEVSRTNKIKETNAALEAEAERVGGVRLKDYLNDSHLFIGTETQKKEFASKRLKDLDEATASTIARLAADYDKNATEIVKIENDKFLRMQKAANDHYGNLWKLMEDQRLAAEKSNRTIANNRATFELAQGYAMVTDSVMAWQNAEKAAAEATLSTTQQQVENLAKLEDGVKKAKQAYDDFLLKALEGNKLGDEGVATTLAQLKATANTASSVLSAATTQAATETAAAASLAYDKVIANDVNRLKNATSDALVTGLLEGGKAGATKLRNILIAEIRKPITMLINVAVNAMLSSVTGALAGTTGDVAGSAGSSLLGSVGSSAIGSTLTATGSNFVAGLNTGFQAVSGGAGLSNTVALGSDLMTSGATSGGLGTMLGGVAPFIASAIAVYYIAKSLEGGEKRSGATYTAGSNGEALFNQGPSGGEIAASQSRSLFASTQTTINGLLASFGSTARVSGFTAGLESSSNGKGFQFAGGYVGGKAFGENLGRTGGQFTMQTQDEGTALKNYTTDLQKSVLEALQVADLGGMVGTWINSLGDIEALTEDQVASAMKQISAFQQLDSVLRQLPFEYLKNLTVKATASLVDAAGGVENLGSALGTYYGLFTSDSDKLKASSAAVSDSLTKLGLSMPTDGLREWYKTQIAAAGAQDLSVESNATAYYSLLKLASGVDAVAKATEEAAKVQEEMLKNRQSWQDKLDIALNKTTQEEVQLKTDLASTTDEATKAIIRQVYAENQKLAVTKKQEESLVKLTDAYKTNLTAQKDLLTTQISAGDTVRKLLDSLKVGVNASTSPQSRLDAARSQYLADLSKARGGDYDAYSRVSTTAQTYISAGSDMYASSEAQKAIIAQVQSELGNLPAVAKYDENLAALNRIEAAIKASAVNTVDAINSDKVDTLQAIHAMALAVTNGFDTMDVNSNGMLTFDELKVGLGVGDRLTQQLINAVDTNGDGQISRLEIIAANTGKIDPLTSAILSSFDMLDANTSGALTFDELKVGLGIGDDLARGLITAIDTNGDGQLSRLELIAANTGEIHPLTSAILSSFTKMDANASGALTFDELKIGLGIGDDLTRGLIATIDTNGDGQLSRLELIAANTAGIDPLKTALISSFAAIDANSSGALTFEELKTGLGVGDSLIRNLIASVDTNGDGQLSKLELIASNTGGLAELDKINKTINQFNWADSNKPAAIAGFSNIAKQNNWSVAQIAAASGYSTAEISKLFSGTGLGTGIGGTGATNTATTAAAATPNYAIIAGIVNSLNWAESNKASSATALYGLSLASGWTQQMIASATGYSFPSIQALFASAGIPAFAVGTNVVPRDMLAQIHEGEAIIPKAFNPWASGGGVSSNDNQALIDEVRELRKEVAKGDGAPIHITIMSQDGKVLAEQVISTIKERSRNREIVIYADGVSKATR